ncbi:MAG: hypothetical protein M0P30_13165, partial [Syntrophorhabdaceae bacterium]|nr:hypothetical protein [Syntrophorhabdaceae bacterium]
ALCFEGYMAGPDEPRLSAQGEDLEEEMLHSMKTGAPEGGDRVVAGVVARSEEPECHVLMGLLLYLPGRRCPNAAGVQEDFDHHRRVVSSPLYAFMIASRESSSTTSDMKWARWFSGSHSRREGGRRYSRS